MLLAGAVPEAFWVVVAERDILVAADWNETRAEDP